MMPLIRDIEFFTGCIFAGVGAIFVFAGNIPEGVAGIGIGAGFIVDGLRDHNVEGKG